MAGQKLTDTAVKQAPAKDKDYKLTDGGWALPIGES